MPSVHIPKKSTATDMTPFVDVAFLILAFFIMATKFKPPEPVEITTPNSVSTDKLPENDAVLVEIDKTGRVFFTMLAEADPEAKLNVIRNLNNTRNLGLSEAEMKNFVRTHSVGVPFTQLKSLLSQPIENQKNVKQPGIPVKDSANNELYYWIRDAITAFSGKKINYLIKGDNASKYPDFKNVLSAFKRNDIYKFDLVTMPEEAPIGSDLYRSRQKQLAGGGNAAANP
ncbi:MAG: biopolymer transporter ExbD [Flavisolibacter sp.]|nr:biopolymer transporter ExbD [Flavisolibacter sp.]MBD0374541.1 biopolymer transporter ExbD [Flavisolibacter sp.]